MGARYVSHLSHSHKLKGSPCKDMRFGFIYKQP